MFTLEQRVNLKNINLQGILIACYPEMDRYMVRLDNGAGSYVYAACDLEAA